MSSSIKLIKFKTLRKIKIIISINDKFGFFLEAFKYGAAPEGGFAFGAERITMQLLELKNIREAAMFPRDMNRIDEKLNSDGY